MNCDFRKILNFFKQKHKTRLITLRGKQIKDFSKNLLEDVNTFLENTKSKNKFTPFGHYKTLKKSKKDQTQEILH